MDETSELLEVAEILLELPQLLGRFSFTWGTKKRRSSMVDTPTFSSTRLSHSPSPPSPQPPPVSESVDATATCETEKEKSKALSPATPLLFSPSESDEKSKPSKRKVSLKRKTEECLRMIQELTERNEFYKEEIKNVQRYYDQQKLLNLQLKASKRMIILGLQRKESQSQWNSNHTMELAQPRFQVQEERSGYMMHQQPLIMADTANHSMNTSQCQYDQKVGSSHGSGSCRDFIPDLNLSLEEPLRLESGSGQLPSLAISGKSEIKALAAQARLRRIQICRSKNPNAATKLRFPSHL